MNEDTKQKIYELWGVSNEAELSQVMSNGEDENSIKFFQNAGEIAEQRDTEIMEGDLSTPQEQYLNELQVELREKYESIPMAEWGNYVDQNVLDDKKYRQEQLRKALHDSARIDSAEQHALDMIGGWFNEDSKVIMDIDQARQYAKEKGVDWNSHDKATISKYELDVLINKELLRRELEQDIINYSQYKDYNALDKIAQLGATISGGVGFIETAATIGLGMLTPAGTAAALARGGALLAKIGGNVYKGARLAQKMEMAQKTINMQSTVLKEIAAANKAVQKGRLAKIESTVADKTKEMQTIKDTIKNESFGTKFGYDFYRFGKLGIPGERASIASVSASFAIDGALTDIPRELIHKTYSDVFDTKEYTNKDMLRDFIIAGGIGAALPFAGETAKVVGKGVSTGLSKTAGTAGKIIGNIQEKVNDKIQKKISDAYVKDNKVEIDALNAEGKDVADMLQEVGTGVKNNNNLSPEALQTAEAMDNLNLNDDEAMSELMSYLHTFTTGENLEVIPPKTQWLTTTPKLYDIASTIEKQGGSIDDIWEGIKNSGNVIVHTGDWSDGRVVPGANLLDEFKSQIDRMYYTKTTAKFKDEKGYLGNRAIQGLYNKETEDMLKNVYIAHLLPDTEVGKLARKNALEYQKYLKDTRDYIKDVRILYNKILEANKSKKFEDYKFSYKMWKRSKKRVFERMDGKGETFVDLKEGKDIVPNNYWLGYTTGDFGTLTSEQFDKEIFDSIDTYGYQIGPIPYDMQQYLFRMTVEKDPTLDSGLYGSAADAVRKIVFRMLPKEIRDKYESTLASYYKKKSDAILAGKLDALKKDISYAENVENIDELIDQTAKDVFINVVTKEYNNAKYGKIEAEFIDFKTLPRGKSSLTGGAKATKGARIEYLESQLDDIIANNEQLLNADEVYQKMLPDADQVLKPQEVKEVIDTTEANRILKQTVSAPTVAKLIKNDSSRVLRFDADRNAFQKALENTDNVNEYNIIASRIQKAETSKEVIAKFNLLKLNKRISTLDEILQEDFTPVINTFFEKLKTNTDIKELFDNPDLMILDKEWQTIKYKHVFHNILKESLNETINSSGKYTELFGDEFEELSKIAADNFDDYLKNNMKEGLKNIITSYNFNVATNTKEEIAHAMLATAKREQLMQSLLNPYFQQLAYKALDMQGNNYRVMTNLLNSIELFRANPGNIDEIVLAKITMSPIVSKGSSLSAEALSNPASEWAGLCAALDRNDTAAIRDGIIPEAIAKNKEFQPLREYARDSENLREIQMAIYDRIRFINNEMTEEEATLYNRQSNTRAARVATEYLNSMAKLKQDLFNVGSNKNKLVNLFDPTKIKDMQYYLPKNKLVGKYAVAIRNHIDSNSKEIRSAVSPLAKLFMHAQHGKEGLSECNMILDCFEKLDLDKQFKNRKRYSLNAVRDALVQEGGIERFIEDSVQERLKSFSNITPEIINKLKIDIFKDIQDACIDISDGFVGKAGVDVGFVNRLRGDITHVKDPLKASFRSKYVEDIEPSLFYKNIEYEKEDIKSFGYDNFKSMFDNNFGTAKKAYAVLSNFGEEPIQYIETLKELAKGYAEEIVPKTHGFEKAEKLKRKLSNTWEKTVDFNMHNVCGTYTIPANNFQKWVQIVVRLASSPMLMKAGLKSLTDYNYQTQMLITMGLATEGDLQARVRVTRQLLSAFSQDKKLAEQIFITQALRADTLYSMLYNSSIGSGDILQGATGTLKQSVGGLNEFAPLTMKAEKVSKWYTQTMLDKIAWIGPLTEYNRSNAAITTMRAIGSYAPTRYKNMPERFQQTLTRFGISEYEWDNVLSKHIVTNAKDYIYQMSEKTVQHELSDYPMFFPELVDKISDADLVKIMTDQKMKITDMTKARYRQYLKDKASLLINTSADEMTSIPTSRIQGMMSGHHLQNSGVATFLNTVLQFQSFGAAINYYQWGRRLAAYQTTDSAFNHLLFEFSGHPEVNLTMAQFLAESMLAEFFVGELIREISGTNRRLVNDRKEFQGDALFDKSVEAIGGALGLGNICTQAILSAIMKAKGQGGGLSVPVLPAVSHLLQHIERVTSAATKKSTEKNRGKAVAGAIGEDVADMLGFPNQPFARAAWGLIIGDTFKEWQYGDRAQAIKTQRLHRGYTPSFTRVMAEKTGIIEPYETSIYSKFTE